LAAEEEFSVFAGLCDKVASTSSKNSKVQLMASYLGQLDGKSLQAAVLFLSGSVFPKGSGAALNIGFGLIMRSLADVTRLDPAEIQKIYMEHGDLGALAEYAVGRKEQNPLIKEQLKISQLHSQLKKMATVSGPGAAETKRRILTGLLISCSPLEAKYLTKIAGGEMRIGAVEGLVEVAISKAFGRELGQVRQAMLLLGDISEVALLAKQGRLSDAEMRPLVPLSFMLADVMFSAEEIAEYYKKPLVCESKYDGIRAQLHRAGSQVKLFSRKLDDITASFPEIAKAAAGQSIQAKVVGGDDDDNDNIILDGELMAYRDGRPLHFQELQKRLRRKEVTEQAMREIPVIYVPYDILYLGKSSVIGLPLSERKRLLSGLALEEPLMDFGYSMVTTAGQIAAAFDASKKAGHEGLVLKDPESMYHPGKRGRYWAKLKTELDTIDAVIVAAEYGHGKRAGTLSDYTFAVRDSSGGDDDDNSGDSDDGGGRAGGGGGEGGRTGRLLTIGKAYSGLTDREIEEMTRRLLSIVTSDRGYRLEVRPEIVLEVAFDSIQKSERHDSGYALRFPRIKYIRQDKTAGDIDTIDKVRRIYENQFHVKAEG
jgi:DNA ligase-1